MPTSLRPSPCTSPSVKANESAHLIYKILGGRATRLPSDTLARISKFTSDGRFIESFGKLGSGRVEFRTPHDITIDPQGRLLVADRGNMRIQILDQDGKFIDEWKQFSRPSRRNLNTGWLDLCRRLRVQWVSGRDPPGMEAWDSSREARGRRGAVSHPPSARPASDQCGRGSGGR